MADALLSDADVGLAPSSAPSAVASAPAADPCGRQPAPSSGPADLHRRPPRRAAAHDPIPAPRRQPAVMSDADVGLGTGRRHGRGGARAGATRQHGRRRLAVRRRQGHRDRCHQGSGAYPRLGRRRQRPLDLSRRRRRVAVRQPLGLGHLQGHEGEGCGPAGRPALAGIRAAVVLRRCGADPGEDRLLPADVGDSARWRRPACRSGGWRPRAWRGRSDERRHARVGDPVDGEASAAQCRGGDRRAGRHGHDQQPLHRPRRIPHRPECD